MQRVLRSGNSAAIARGLGHRWAPGRRPVLPQSRWMASTRQASTPPRDDGYELLKSDFRRWLRREAQVLTLLVTVGLTGVYFYQRRESAPSQRVLRLLDLAAKDAKAENREAALKHCLQAYSITKATNAQDRHLFELAFSIAAQYETLGRSTPAAKYYIEAMGNLPYVPSSTERDVGRVVVLDRIAQCYQDQGEQASAENYYRQAVAFYDKRRSQADGRAKTTSTGDAAQIDREIVGVLFNYGQQLMHLRRWTEARRFLRRARAQSLAVGGSESDRDRIDRLLGALKEEKGDEDVEL